MEYYLMYLKRLDDRYQARCPALNVVCDAESPGAALAGCRVMCVNEGRDLLLAGNPLPAEDGLDLLFDDDFGAGIFPDERIVLGEFSLMEEYAGNASSPVRRTVSLPEWLDRRLRRAGADASRLFQDAAMDYLKRAELERRGVPKIANLSDLEDACLPGVLDKYFGARLAGILGDSVL